MGKQSVDIKSTGSSNRGSNVRIKLRKQLGFKIGVFATVAVILVGILMSI